MTPDIENQLRLSDISETERLARRISKAAAPGDAIFLTGDLGSGKTTFARAFIRGRAVRFGIEIGDVPSPTFTLVQLYEMPYGNIWHFDLYRLEHPRDAIELGIEDASRDGICLIEWPDRLPPLTFAARLDLTFEFGGPEDERRVKIAGDRSWRDRVVEVLQDE
jgi:tRNA threonylcarbamoyladenosine biosynthesis protein TsaE